MADYLPGPDADYQAWVTNFVTYANANLAALGLVAADMTPVTTGQTAFNSGFSAHIAAKPENRRNSSRSLMTCQTHHPRPCGSTSLKPHWKPFPRRLPEFCKRKNAM